MGVPTLLRWLKERCKDCIKKGLNGKNPTGLCIDAVGYIHLATHKYYGEIGKELTKEQYDILSTHSEEEIDILISQFILEEIKIVINKVSPKDYILVAFDGVCPLAKTIQRKQRRWKIGKLIHDVKENGGDIYFDPNSISAGTKFMDSIISKVRDLLKSYAMTIDRKIEMHFTSHRSHGEGEHKIMDFLRGKYSSNNRVQYRNGKRVLIKSLDTVVIAGDDGDLMLLGMVFYGADIVIMRKGYSKPSLIHPESKTPVVHDYIHCENLRDAVRVLMWPDRSEPSYEDFILLTLFIGNDFLPPVPECEEHLLFTLNTLIEVYASMNKSNRLTLVNRDMHINWDAMSRFLKRVPIDKFLLNIYSSSKMYLWGHPCIDYIKIQDVDSKTFDLFEGVNIEGFKSKYYSSRLGLWGQEYIECNSGYDMIDINEMCMMWFQGITWVILYYTKGITKDCTPEWYYPHSISPSISDLSHFLWNLSEENKSKLILPIHFDRLILGEEVHMRGKIHYLTALEELIAILPRESLHLLPKIMRLTLEKESEVLPLYTYYEQSCKMKEYKGITLVPPIDVDEIRRVHSIVSDNLAVKTINEPDKQKFLRLR